MLTPDDVHHGRAQGMLEQRQHTLEAAWAAHPERFVRGIPKPSPLPRRGLDQPTRNINDRRDCSVNRAIGCLIAAGRR